MKITVFNGSPRGRKSNSHRIVDPLLEGARQAGAQTEEIFLTEYNINHCCGCFSCWTKTPGKCVINDDMSNLIDLFFESDYVGMATPVYGLFMTSILKKFNERLLPTATPHIHKNEDGSCYHEERMHYPRFFMIANAGFPGEHNFDLFKAYMASQNPVLEVYRNSGGVLEDWPNENVKKRINEFYDALREAGKEMVNGGQVSEDIIKSIHAELISDDEFMAGVNQYWDEEITKGDL